MLALKYEIWKTGIRIQVHGVDEIAVFIHFCKILFVVI